MSKPLSIRGSNILPMASTSCFSRYLKDRPSNQGDPPSINPLKIKQLEEQLLDKGNLAAVLFWHLESNCPAQAVNCAYLLTLRTPSRLLAGIESSTIFSFWTISSLCVNSPMMGASLKTCRPQ